MNDPLLIYGANGYTGELIAREAVRRGLSPILAGRRREPVEALARELGLASRIFALDDPETTRRHLEGAAAVLHCAGPFVHTSRPMVDACLATSTHYLDVTGEIEVFEAILARDDEARQARVTLLPGVGFDVVPTDCLAARLAQAQPEATHLELAFTAEGGTWSRGTLKTMVESFPRGGAIRRQGRIEEVPLAYADRVVDFPCGRRSVVSIGWGDVATAYRSTGIPNIQVYTAMPPTTLRRLRASRWLLPLLGLRPVKRFLQRRIEGSVTGPDETTRRTARSYIWGRAWVGEGTNGEGGREVSGSVETPEGYRFTAASAVEAAHRLCGGSETPVKPGALTPSLAFGASFVETLEGVSVSWP